MLSAIACFIAAHNVIARSLLTFAAGAKWTGKTPISLNSKLLLRKGTRLHMDINSAFPSKYLRAADLGTNTPTVTIAHVKSKLVGEDQRMVVYFVGKDKGLVLNKTNANAIADILGQTDTDDWPEGRIKLVTAKVDFQGKRVPAIRVDEPAPPANTNRPRPAPTVVETPDEDSIPF